jgi:hypothetical protein
VKKKKPESTVNDAAARIDPSQLPSGRQLTSAEQKLDEVLIDWVRAYKEGGGPAANRYAEKKSIKLEDDKMWVKLTANFDPASSPAKMPPLVEKIKGMGGTIRTTFENQVYVLISAKAVGELAESESVWSMTAETTIAQPLSK